MDPNFSFPRRRPRPQQQKPSFATSAIPSSSSTPPSSSNSTSRESSALRASVLDAALLLGVGSNSTVTNWMFNNTTQEEDESQECEVNSSPGLTSPSTATSEESVLSSPAYVPYTPLLPLVESAKKPGPYLPFSFTNLDLTNHNHPSLFPDPSPTPRSANPSPYESTSNAPPFDKSPKKLKKRRGGGQGQGDEYESDGGLISGTNAPKRASKEPVITAPRRSQEEDKKKSAKSFEDRGYDTDVSKLVDLSKSKSKRKPKQKHGSPDGFETDDGSILMSPSKTKRTRSFFRLASKSSKSEMKHHRDTPDIPPVPPVSAGPPRLPPPFIPELFPGSSRVDHHTTPVSTPGFVVIRTSLSAPTPSTAKSSSASSSPPPTLMLPPIPAPLTLPAFISTPMTAPASAPIVSTTKRFSPPPSNRSASSLSRSGTATSVSTTSSGEDTDIKSTKSSRRRGLQFNRQPRHGTGDSISSAGHSSAIHSSVSNHSPPPFPPPSSSPPNPADLPTPVRPLSPRKRAPPPHPLAINIPRIVAEPAPASAPEIVIPAPLPSPSGTIVPSSAFIVPSPRSSILGNYDIPPPSPPPTGPLPLPPPLPSSLGPSPLSSSVSTRLDPRQQTLQPIIPLQQRGRPALTVPGNGMLYPRVAGSSKSLSPSPLWVPRDVSPSPSSAPPVQAPSLPLPRSTLTPTRVLGLPPTPNSAPLVRARPPRPAMRGPPPSAMNMTNVGQMNAAHPPAVVPRISRSGSSSTSTSSSSSGGHGMTATEQLRGRESPFPVKPATPSPAIVSALVPTRSTSRSGNSTPGSVMSASPISRPGSANGHASPMIGNSGNRPQVAGRVRTPVQGPSSVPPMRAIVPESMQMKGPAVSQKRETLKREFRFPASGNVYSAERSRVEMRDNDDDNEGTDSDDDFVQLYRDEDASEDGDGDAMQDVLDVLGRFSDFGAVRRAQGGVPVDVENSPISRDRLPLPGGGGGVGVGREERFRDFHLGNVNGHASDPNRLDPADPDSSLDMDEEDDDTVDDLRGELEDRLNRYSTSPSMYSRASILDGERSREAHARFVRRVAAMTDGDEDVGVVSPLSKLRTTTTPLRAAPPLRY